MGSFAKKIKGFAKPIVEWSPALADAYRNWRDKRLAKRTPVMTPMGFYFAGTPEMEAGEFEPRETELIIKIIKNVDVFVNAGANIGYYVCHALKLSKYVIAFEPMPLNVERLRRNVYANGWNGNIEIFSVALAAKQGAEKIYGSGTGASLIRGWGGVSGKSFQMIPATTLDVALGKRLLGKKVLVLADVEGAEYGVLLGAKELLSSIPNSIWCIEIVLMNLLPTGFERNANFLPTFEIFWKYGYEAYDIHDGKVRPVGRDMVENAVKERTSFSDSNFIFVHRSMKEDWVALLTS
jgi:FkbM family methyltransferase